MLQALHEHFDGRASWTRPQGGLFVWATLDGVDTTDLMGRSRGVAFVPGRSAYMDGRSGSGSMRLNFAGVPDEDIREGIKRIASLIDPDTGLLGTDGPPAHESAEPTDVDDERVGLADIVALPRREQPGSARRRQQNR
jgi:2-aminoadipate transaminase